MKYDKYKNSGAEWLGDIPLDWKTGVIGSFYTLRNEKVSDTDYPPLSVTMKGIVPQLETAAKTDAHDARKLVLKGDFAINSRSDRRGSCGVSQYDGSVSLINTVLTPRNNMSPRYYDWLFHTVQFADEYYKNGHGIVDDLWTTRWNEMKRILIPVPSIDTQETIARYLDGKIAHIDSIIAEAKASIEEYKAWKASIIYEAVTKGLDPNVEMKDSGVEWIGKIPIGWEVIRLKYFISGYKAGPFGSSLITDRLNPSGNVLVYTPEHIAKKSVDLDKNLYLPDERIEEMQQFIVETGDIIFPIVGSLGRSMLITEEMPTGIINQRLAKFKLDTERLLMDYFLWLFSRSSFYSTYIDLYCRGSIIVNLTKQIVGNMPIPLPATKEEQKRICEYLESKCSKVDFMIAEKESLIEDLEAYKKSLIFEVVTGKKKVC